MSFVSFQMENLANESSFFIYNLFNVIHFSTRLSNNELTRVFIYAALCSKPKQIIPKSRSLLQKLAFISLICE